MARIDTPAPAFAPGRPDAWSPEGALDVFRQAADGSPAEMQAFDALVHLALAPGTAEAATRHLFTDVVEPLCDAFTARGAARYARLFRRVIDIARTHPDGRAFDDALRRCPPREMPASMSALDARALRCVLLPSRVTLGADVAVTNVLIQAVRAACPHAEIVLLGPDTSVAALHGIAGASQATLPYARHATLMNRLDAWRGLRDLVCEHGRGIPAGRLLFLDPDSRFTQLGLLPPLPAAQVRHFPSRSLGPPETDPTGGTLGALAAGWVARLFGRPALARLRPALAVPRAAAAWAAALRAAWDVGDARPVVAAHFGVGGCAAKRVGPAFERQVLEGLVREGCRVLLARGAGAAELAEAGDLQAALLARGLSVTALPAGRASAALSGADVVTWEADVDAMLAVLGSADAYLGYDSAGQHIAAALGVPTVSVFVATGGPRHRARWTPSGPGPVRVIPVQPARCRDVSPDRVAAEVAAMARTAGAGRRDYA